MRIRIGDKVWRVTRRSPENRKRRLVGFADHRKRLMWFAKRLQGQDLLDTIIHEFLHAKFPDMSEDAVTLTANQLTRLLVRMYRELESANRKT